MNLPNRFLCVFLLCPGLLFAQQKPTAPLAAKPHSSAAVVQAESNAAAPESPAKLPVRRVVLSKNGVGYFEHLGRVSGSQGMHIDFTSAQLNDALMSLTVLALSIPLVSTPLLPKAPKRPMNAFGLYRCKLDVPAKATASLPVEEVRVLQSNFQLADLDDAQNRPLLQKRLHYPGRGPGAPENSRPKSHRP